MVARNSDGKLIRRPLSPHLQVYHWPISMALSIGHRITGMGLIVQWAATNTIAQTVVDDDKLGRVISLYAVVFFAGAPIGALVEGSLATAIGPIHTLALAGAACMAGTFVFGRPLTKEG